MRALVTDEYGHGDPQRQVLVAHAIDAADFARRLIDRAGECTDAELVTDWQLAATGRDLYFDSKLGPDAIRGRFGDRVERMIAGLSDRVPAAQYPQFVAEFAEELGVIRLAGVIDNIATCTGRILDLDPHWVGATFEPLVRNGIAIWKRPQFVRYWKTGAILIRAIEREHGLLLAKIAAVTRPEAEAGPARPPLTSAAILRRSLEREHREGWLLRGMRALFTMG